MMQPNDPSASSASTSNATTPAKPHSPEKKVSHSVKLPSYFLRHFSNTTFLILLALFISMLSFMFNMRETKNLKDEMHDILLIFQNTHVEQRRNLENNLQELRNAYAEIEKKSQKQDQELQMQIKNLNQLNQQVPDDIHWKVSQIDYYLNLAQLNLQYQHRPEGARILLEQANKMLTALNDPKYTNLKEEINKSIEILAALNEHAATALLEQVNRLKVQISALSANTPVFKSEKPVDNESNATTENAAQPNPPSSPSFWQKSWNHLSAQLEKIVTVQRMDDATFPPLTSLQQYTLQFYMDFLLKMTEMAILQENQKTYQLSLSQLQDLIKRYYPNTSSPAEIAKILEQIDQLKNKDLIPNMPNLNNILGLWQSIQVNIPSNTNTNTTSHENPPS